MKTSVLQLGQLPPPYGGITRHIQGLKYNLDKDNVPNDVKSFYCRSFLSAALKYKILHSHEIRAIPQILLPCFRLIGKRIVIGIHGEGLEDRLTQNNMLKLNAAGKILLKLALKYYNAFVVGNDKIKKFLISQGVKSNKIFIIPEFIPFEEFSTEENPEVSSFVNGRKYFFSCGDLRKYHNEYLYGFDLILEFAKTHKYLENDYCFLINIIGNNSPNQIEPFKDFILKYNLDKFVYLNCKSFTSMQLLIKNTFVFLRTTNTDGNALSILEALQLKVPVIASDVVPRPKSCILFKNRNLEDLTDKILNLLITRDSEATKIHEDFDSYERIKHLYESLK